MEEHKSSKLLILKGVKLEHLNAKPVPRTAPPKVYTVIPKVFTGVASWPKRSNLKCWHCGLVPTNYPKFWPMYPRVENDIDVCDVRGHFCEWSCMLAYASGEAGGDIYDLTKTAIYFQSLFTNERRPISIAPPKTERRGYCGASGISTAEYRRLLRQ